MGTIPEVTAAYEESLVPRPDAERVQVLREMMAQTVEQAPELWISQPTTLLAGIEDISGFH